MSHNVQHARGPSKSIGLETSNQINSVDIDEMFTLLSNSRRRAAILVMFDHERLDFGELVDHVAEAEYQLPIDDISSDERHSIYVSMYQTHASPLEDAGIIERDPDTGTVSLGPNADEMRCFLEKTELLPDRGGLKNKVASLF